MRGDANHEESPSATHARLETREPRQQPRQMLLIILLTLASPGSAGVGEDASALVNRGCTEGNGALPVRRESGVNDGGTDGLAGEDKPPE
jgi:hypothetical protein